MAFTAPTISPEFEVLDPLFFWAFAQIPAAVDWDVSTIENACRVAFAVAALLAIGLAVALFWPHQVHAHQAAVPAGERPPGKEPSGETVGEILRQQLTKPRQVHGLVLLLVGALTACGLALLSLSAHNRLRLGQLSDTIAFATMLSGGAALFLLVERGKTSAEFRAWRQAQAKWVWAQSWWDYWRKTETENLKTWQDYRPGYMDYVRRLDAWNQARSRAIAEVEANKKLRDQEVPRLIADFHKALTAVRYQAALDNPPITAEADLLRLFAAAFPDLPVARDPMLTTMLPYIANTPLVALVADRYAIGRAPPVVFDEAGFAASNPKPVPPQRPSVVYYSNWEPLEHWQQRKGQWYPRDWS